MQLASFLTMAGVAKMKMKVECLKHKNSLQLQRTHNFGEHPVPCGLDPNICHQEVKLKHYLGQIFAQWYEEPRILVSIYVSCET